MCDTYVPTIGYICNECQKEFKEWLGTYMIPHATAGEIEKALAVYIQIPREYEDNNEISVDEFFNAYTR